MSFPALRMRRLRRTPLVRELVREVTLAKSDLVQPLFIEEGLHKDAPIPSMPGQFRLAPSSLQREGAALADRGVRAIILFGIPRQKDELGSSAMNPKGVVQTAIHELKDEFGDRLVVLTDVCMCQYTSHGHCGIVRDGVIDNDETVKRLGEI